MTGRSRLHQEIRPAVRMPRAGPEGYPPAGPSCAQRPLETGVVIRLDPRRSDLRAIPAIILAISGGPPCARDDSPTLGGPPVLLAPREHRPDDAGVLGRERHRRDLVPPPLLPLLRPASLGIRALACALEHTAGPMDQQRAKRHIPTLTDVAQARLTAAGIWLGDTPPPRRTRPAMLARVPIPDRRHNSGGRRGSHTFARPQMLRRLTLARQLCDPAVVDGHPLVQVPAPFLSLGDDFPGAYW